MAVEVFHPSVKSDPQFAPRLSEVSTQVIEGIQKLKIEFHRMMLGFMTGMVGAVFSPREEVGYKSFGRETFERSIAKEGPKDH